MKPIRICRENATTIEAALKAVNGAATAHTYTTMGVIAVLSKNAEERLDALGIPVKDRAGAEWRETSGGRMPNAYARKASTRVATTVVLARRKAGWFLVSVERAEVWQQGGGDGRLTLTQGQADIATAKFAAGFTVAKATT